MNYADLTIFTVGFIGFIASLIEVYNFLSVYSGRKLQVSFFGLIFKLRIHGKNSFKKITSLEFMKNSKNSSLFMPEFLIPQALKKI